MGVFTFVCRSSGGEWSAKQLSGDLEASAASTFDLQRLLVQEALAVDSTGGVQSSFSMVSPSSAVFQVIIGGGGGGAFIGAGAPGGAAAGSGGGSAAPDAPPTPEEKKEEKEESDDDMGFSLFD
ncbi:large ribosomal subunit protein P3-like isoform X2 [Musa acuminata AAA Group]|uniref:large ribosomal subunit protein P3-like isoform X2 n=1 Tax=Musa acuminata AAA Group TaxID=214697 RepID=UPI0031E0E7C6